MAGGIQPTSSRGRGRMRRHTMADINVTPFVDVMLVLLIVFMVTAPMLTPPVNWRQRLLRRLPRPQPPIAIWM